MLPAGCVKKKERERNTECYVLTNEKLENTGGSNGKKPKRSLSRLAIQCGVSKATVHVSKKELVKIHLYTIKPHENCFL